MMTGKGRLPPPRRHRADAGRSAGDRVRGDRKPGRLLGAGGGSWTRSSCALIQDFWQPISPITPGLTSCSPAPFSISSTRMSASSSVISGRSRRRGIVGLAVPPAAITTLTPVRCDISFRPAGVAFDGWKCCIDHGAAAGLLEARDLTAHHVEVEENAGDVPSSGGTKRSTSRCSWVSVMPRSSRPSGPVTVMTVSVHTVSSIHRQASIHAIRPRSAAPRWAPDQSAESTSTPRRRPHAQARSSRPELTRPAWPAAVLRARRHMAPSPQAPR